MKSEGLQSRHIFRAKSVMEIDSQASEQKHNASRLSNEEFVNRGYNLAPMHPGFRKILPISMSNIVNK